MSIASSFMFALLVYGLGAVISFGVALLIKGMFAGMRLFTSRPAAKKVARIAPVFSRRHSSEPVEAH